MSAAPESRTLYASAARTATVTGGDQTNFHHRGLHLIINVTALAATPSVTPKIQGKDANGIYYDILVGTAITDVTVGTPPSTTVLKVYPGITAVANGAASDVLPHVWRVVLTHGDSDSITYSVAVNLLP